MSIIVTLGQRVHVSLREPPHEGREGALEDGVVDVEEEGGDKSEVVEPVLPTVGVHLKGQFSTSREDLELSLLT